MLQLRSSIAHHIEEKFWSVLTDYISDIVV